MHFTAAGDYGNGSNSALVLNGIAAQQPELDLALGDLSYAATGTEQAYCDFVTSRLGAGFPFEVVSGNHESNGLNGNVNDFTACLPNQPARSRRHLRAAVVRRLPEGEPDGALRDDLAGVAFPDGTWSYAAGTPRYQWTSDVIDAARAAGIPWVVVGMHKPCVSTGQYGCEGSVRDVTDLLLRKRVDLVLNGHEHIYQRTKQARLGTGCSTLATGTVDTDCIADAGDQLRKGAGTVVATVGTGGVMMRDVNPADTEAGYFAQARGGQHRSQPRVPRRDGRRRHPHRTLRPGDRRLHRPVLDHQRRRTAEHAAGRRHRPAGLQRPHLHLRRPRVERRRRHDRLVGLAARRRQHGHRVDHHARVRLGRHLPGDADGHRRRRRDGLGDPLGDGHQRRAAPIAADDFTRTLSSGWGTATTGGGWTITGGSSVASVSGGVGRLVMATAGSGPAAFLQSVSSSATDTAVTLSTDKAATAANGISLSVVGRRITSAGATAASLRLHTDGTVRVSLERATSAGAETAVVPATLVPGLVVAPGDPCASACR
nr:metallophosphoesterase [Angustibacter aerolatus]